jgi:hypothetical protein
MGGMEKTGTCASASLPFSASSESTCAGVAKPARKKPVQTFAGQSQSQGKTYLNVPFARKHEVKALGGKWDAKLKQWYVLTTNPNLGGLLDSFGF